MDKWIALIVFGSVGIAALAGGLRWGAKRHQITSTGLRAEGIVVDQVEHKPPSQDRWVSRPDSENFTSYAPLVEFETEQGEKIRVEGTTGGAEPVLETGEHVGVVYDPDDPSRAVILDFEQAWLGPLALSIAGAIFLAFGVGGYFLLADSDRSPSADDLFEQGRMEMQQQLEHRSDPERQEDASEW